MKVKNIKIIYLLASISMVISGCRIESNDPQSNLLDMSFKNLILKDSLLITPIDPDSTNLYNREKYEFEHYIFSMSGVGPFFCSLNSYLVGDFNFAELNYYKNVFKTSNSSKLNIRDTYFFVDNHINSDYSINYRNSNIESVGSEDLGNINIVHPRKGITLIKCNYSTIPFTESTQYTTIKHPSESTFEYIVEKFKKNNLVCRTSIKPNDFMLESSLKDQEKFKDLYGFNLKVPPYMIEYQTDSILYFKYGKNMVLSVCFSEYEKSFTCFENGNVQFYYEFKKSSEINTSRNILNYNPSDIAYIISRDYSDKKLFYRWKYYGSKMGFKISRILKYESRNTGSNGMPNRFGKELVNKIITSRIYRSKGGKPYIFYGTIKSFKYFYIGERCLSYDLFNRSISSSINGNSLDTSDYKLSDRVMLR